MSVENRQLLPRSSGFTSVSVDSKSGMFASEKERFTPNRLESQQVDAEKKRQQQHARLENIRNNNIAITQRITQSQMVDELREKANVHRKVQGRILRGETHHQSQ